MVYNMEPQWKMLLLLLITVSTAYGQYYNGRAYGSGSQSYGVGGRIGRQGKPAQVGAACGPTEFVHFELVTGQV